MLDRVPVGEPKSGWSKFSIEPGPYLLQCLQELERGLDLRPLNGKIGLPPNLLLRATMNTSDQSLMPLDSAFKRRWTMRYCPIDYDNEESFGKRRVAVQAKPLLWRSWSNFLGVINRVVTEATESDDKQIGPWFVTDRDIPPETFQDKILFFLWHDVFRHSPETLFDSEIKSFNRLVRAYRDGEQIFNRAVAKELSLDDEDGSDLGDT